MLLTKHVMYTHSYICLYSDLLIDRILLCCPAWLQTPGLEAILRLHHADAVSLYSSKMLDEKQTIYLLGSYRACGLTCKP